MVLWQMQMSVLQNQEFRTLRRVRFAFHEGHKLTSLVGVRIRWLNQHSPLLPW